MDMLYISYLIQMLFSPPSTVMLAVLTSYFIGVFSDLYTGSGARHPIYVFNCDRKLVCISAAQLLFNVLLSPAMCKTRLAKPSEGL